MRARRWPLSYAGREAHKEVLAAMRDPDVDVGVLAAARRSGKTGLDLTCLVDHVRERPERLGWFLAPTFAMARELAWDPFLSMLGPMAVDVNRSQLSLRVRGGGRIWCKSADNPDSLLGRGLTMVAADEFQSMAPNIYDSHLRPLLAETPTKPRGKLLLSGTPRGKSHPFYTLWKRGQDRASPGWRAWHMTAYEAGMVPRAEVDKLRAEAAARGRTALKLFEREWEASWDAFVGQVFDAWDPNVHIVRTHPKEWGRLVLGKDWGFSESHAGALTSWVETDYGWHCAEEVVATHQTVETFWVPRVAEQAEKWGKGKTRRTGQKPAMYADPARPDHIATMRMRQKGRWDTYEANNQVMEGIVTMAEWIEGRDPGKRITVHASCETLATELGAYQWEQTGDGAFKEKPKKVGDNAVDSARYALHSVGTRPGLWMA